MEESTTPLTEEPKTLTLVHNPPVGPVPVRMTCPYCYRSIISAINHKISILSGCCCLCMPCVYWNKNCLAREHVCPNCYRYLGTYDA